MPRGKRRNGRRGRPSALAAISTIELKQELDRRRDLVQDLLAQRDALNAELDALGAAESATWPRRAGRARRGPGRPSKLAMQPRGRRAAGRTPAGRPRNPTSLVSTLSNVLQGKTYSVADLTEAVKGAGYKTSSPNFRTIVNAALLANPKIFKKVARGTYTAR